MDMRISVVEMEKRRMFECNGVRFDRDVYASSFGPELTSILFCRDGELFDQGTLGTFMPFAENSDRLDDGFIGFTKEALSNDLDHMSSFTASDLNVGDEIVFVGADTEAFLRLQYVRFLATNNDWRTRMAQEFPYPINWKERIDEVKAIYESKIARTREAIATGEIPFLRLCSPKVVRPLGAKEFQIEVRERDGRNWFVSEEVYFDCLPVLPFFWEAADCLAASNVTIEISRGEQKFDPLYVEWVGTHGACVVFHSCNREMDIFLEKGFCAHYLLPSSFLAGDSFVVKSPFELDFLEELASYAPPDFFPELAEMFSAEALIVKDREAWQVDLRSYFNYTMQVIRAGLARARQLKEIRYRAD